MPTAFRNPCELLYPGLASGATKSPMPYGIPEDNLHVTTKCSAAVQIHFMTPEFIP